MWVVPRSPPIRFRRLSPCNKTASHVCPRAALPGHLMKSARFVVVSGKKLTDVFDNFADVVVSFYRAHVGLITPGTTWHSSSERPPVRCGVLSFLTIDDGFP